MQGQARLPETDKTPFALLGLFRRIPSSRLSLSFRGLWESAVEVVSGILLATRYQVEAADDAAAAAAHGGGAVSSKSGMTFLHPPRCLEGLYGRHCFGTKVKAITNTPRRHLLAQETY